MRTIFKRGTAFYRFCTGKREGRAGEKNMLHAPKIGTCGGQKGRIFQEKDAKLVNLRRKTRVRKKSCYELARITAVSGSSINGEFFFSFLSLLRGYI